MMILLLIVFIAAVYCIVSKSYATTGQYIGDVVWLVVKIIVALIFVGIPLLFSQQILW